MFSILKNDDVEELNLRLNALRSLAGAKKQKSKSKTEIYYSFFYLLFPIEFKSKRKRTNENSRYIKDDIDLRSPNKNRSSSSRYNNQSFNNDDREYLLDKDYRQPGVFDMLLSLFSPDNNNNINNSSSSITNKKLVDNYDIQQMDIVDDYAMTQPPLPPLPPPPPPLPPNHLPFFDPLPPLPPPPPSLFNIFNPNQPFTSTNWPRPNFVQPTSNQNDSWQPSFNHSTDIDLRLQPMSIGQVNESLIPKNSQQQRRKRSKKSSKRHHRHENKFSTIVSINRTDDVEKPEDQSLSIAQENNATTKKHDNDDDDEEERLLREELLRTLTIKRKVTTVEKSTPEPERIVIIEPVNSPPTNVTPTPPVVTNKRIEPSVPTQYSINQRYKRVKANVSSTNLANKTETTTTAKTTIIQTRNKIVRVVSRSCCYFVEL